MFKKILEKLRFGCCKTSSTGNDVNAFIESEQSSEEKAE